MRVDRTMYVTVAIRHAHSLKPALPGQRAQQLGERQPEVIAAVVNRMFDIEFAKISHDDQLALEFVG